MQSRCSEEQEKETKRAGSIGRESGGRQLSENPDQIIKATVIPFSKSDATHLFEKTARSAEHKTRSVAISREIGIKSCTGCGKEIAESIQTRMERYDKIDISPIKPIVTRVERYGCKCENCGQEQIPEAPAGMVSGSPFGQRIAALVTTMRYSHGISYRRMQQMMGEVFGLDISEGAIANLLSRVKGQLEPEVENIVEAVRNSRLVCSDETSARVNGKNAWEWVFQNEQVCFHIIRPSRGGDVIVEVMGEHQPEVWVSDLFSAQKTHPAAEWQVCLAHQLRDCQYGIDAGDEVFSGRMKKLLLRAFSLHRRWADLAETTRYQYRCRLYRDLEAVLALLPIQEDGVRLQKRYLELRENLFLFLDDPTIPPTNNASEQALRWSVIFRKITNGFRSDWGKDLFAAVRSIVNTGKRQGLSAFQSILAALNPLEALFPLS
ncbi:IS66 family transposase [Tumidithrix helvetica]|uniref:IS66 family transposase n=1 Tax=Tumidithrix helvetica TaxID=3457545 RepID=UPI003CC52F5C